MQTVYVNGQALTGLAFSKVGCQGLSGPAVSTFFLGRLYERLSLDRFTSYRIPFAFQFVVHPCIRFGSYLLFAMVGLGLSFGITRLTILGNSSVNM